jgi:hypothetical protein
MFVTHENRPGQNEPPKRPDYTAKGCVVEPFHHGKPFAIVYDSCRSVALNDWWGIVTAFRPNRVRIR